MTIEERVKYLERRVLQLTAALRQIEHRTEKTNPIHMIAKRAWRRETLVQKHQKWLREQATSLSIAV
jgi:hypothetical protein